MKRKFLTQVFHNGLRSILKHPKLRWVAIGGALLYFISPIDLATDMIPVVGWIDDGLLASLIVAEVSQIAMTEFKNRKRSPKLEPAESGSDLAIDLSI